MTHSRTAVVVGVSGIAGSYLARHLLDTEDWLVHGVSRRAPAFAEGHDRYRHVAVDLTDASATRDALSALGDATHVFFCAYLPGASEAETTRLNTDALRHCLDGLLAARPPLHAVVTVQGTKYYGCHLGPFKTPAKESDPRLPGETWFYYHQEDLLIERSRGQDWYWTAVRPHSICGLTVGTPLNIISILAAYGAILKELGLPFTFPGRPGAWNALYQLTDAQVLARGMEWTATTPACAGQAFNLTNGDLFRWRYVWPALAEHFAMPLGEPEPRDLVAFMADKAPVWDRVVERQGLRPTRLSQMADWAVANYFFGAEWDIVSDMTKTHRHGFVPAVDSQAMLLRLLSGMREQRFVP